MLLKIELLVLKLNFKSISVVFNDFVTKNLAFF